MIGNRPILKNGIQPARIAVVAILVTAFSISCSDPNAKEWGLRSIDYQRSLNGESWASIVDDTFRPRLSSSRYEVRLFFPDIEFRVGSDEYDALEQGIVRSHHGLSISIESGDQPVFRCEYDSTSALRDYAFNTNEPLSIWLGSGLSFKRNEEYRIRVDAPEGIRGDSIRTVLVVGAGYGPSL